MKLIVQNGANSKPIKHESILFQSSPDKINAFLCNPFRDKIEYPPEFYYKNIRIAAHSDIVNQQERAELSSNGMII